MQSEILTMTATGTVDKREAHFEIKPNPRGHYVLSKVIGRKQGTRANNIANSVFVETLDEVADLMTMERNGKPMYYVWLTYSFAGITRRHQFSPKNVTIHWRE